MIGAAAVLELASAAPPLLTVAIVNRASLGTDGEALLDLTDHARCALARRSLEGEARMGEVEMAVGPEHPPVDERRRIIDGRWIDELHGDVGD